MGLTSARFLLCDACREPIAADVTAHFLDARVYGVTAHLSCVKGMSAHGILRLLGIDDIMIANTETVLEQEYDPDQEKFIFAKDQP